MTEPRPKVPDHVVFESAIKLDRSIGLIGSISIVVGAVVGIGIFIMVAPVGAYAHTSLWLAICLAMTMSLSSVIPVIQLAGALPRAGGGYFFTSRMMAPGIGTMTSWWVILGGGSSATVVSVGLAGYAIDLLPASLQSYLPPNLLAVLILFSFYGLYHFGVKVAASLQVILTVQMLLALAIYAFAGMKHVDMDYSLVFPRGFGGFVPAIILSYSICMGFQVISELGEEIHNAKRNIPLSLAIGGVIILVLYIIVGTVFVNSFEYDFNKLMAMKAPVTESAQTFLSPFWVHFLNIGAFGAGLTSLNAAAISLPRELFAQARDGVMPGWLAEVDPKSHSPRNAVSIFFLCLGLLAFSGWSVEFYGYMAAVGISVLTIVLCVCALRLESHYPERLAQAYIVFPRWILWMTTIVTCVGSLGFIIIIVIESLSTPAEGPGSIAGPLWDYTFGSRPNVLVIYTLWSLAVGLFYWCRKRYLAGRSIDLVVIARVIPGEDEE